MPFFFRFFGVQGSAFFSGMSADYICKFNVDFFFENHAQKPQVFLFFWDTEGKQDVWLSIVYFFNINLTSVALLWHETLCGDILLDNIALIKIHVFLLF